MKSDRDGILSSVRNSNNPGYDRGIGRMGGRKNGCKEPPSPGACFVAVGVVQMFDASHLE